MCENRPGPDLPPLSTYAFNCRRAQLRTEEGEGLVSRLGGGGGVLERKSDPTQERSDPPISVAARALIERRALITAVGVAACAT